MIASSIGQAPEWASGPACIGSKGMKRVPAFRAVRLADLRAVASPNVDVFEIHETDRKVQFSIVYIMNNALEGADVPRLSHTVLRFELAKRGELYNHGGSRRAATAIRSSADPALVIKTRGGLSPPDGAQHLQLVTPQTWSSTKEATQKARDASGPTGVSAAEPFENSSEVGTSRAAADASLLTGAGTNARKIYAVPTAGCRARSWRRLQSTIFMPIPRTWRSWPSRRNQRKWRPGRQ